jgi:GNAT superfamily N-acetyltransferase
MSDIRLLTDSDIPSAMRLSEAANWNQTPEDWARLLRVEPEGCFGLESHGELVATATAVRFGTELAWIGMVLTDPAHRRKGYARILMEHTMAWLAEKGVDWWKLDATDMGQPLYERLGFELESPIERWVGEAPQTAAVQGMELGEPDSALDRRAFGADRTRMLATLSEEWATLGPRGFAAGRPGANARMFGPCVAVDSDSARLLLEWYLASHPGEKLYWDLLPSNPKAVEIAEQFGFTLQRKLARMVLRGREGAPPLETDDSLVYAAAGFEYG